MSIEVLVALISGASAVIGSFIGVLSGQTLTKYRIEHIENEIKSIDNFGNRILALEIKLDEMHKDLIKLEKNVEDDMK